MISLRTGNTLCAASASLYLHRDFKDLSRLFDEKRAVMSRRGLNLNQKLSDIRALHQDVYFISFSLKLGLLDLFMAFASEIVQAANLRTKCLGQVSR